MDNRSRSLQQGKENIDSDPIFDLDVPNCVGESIKLGNAPSKASHKHGEIVVRIRSRVSASARTIEYETDETVAIEAADLVTDAGDHRVLQKLLPCGLRHGANP
jgi:hypothetical protein